MGKKKSPKPSVEVFPAKIHSATDQRLDCQRLLPPLKVFLLLQPGMKRITKKWEGTQTRRKPLQEYKRPEEKLLSKYHFLMDKRRGGGRNSTSLLPPLPHPNCNNREVARSRTHHPHPRPLRAVRGRTRKTVEEDGLPSPRQANTPNRTTHRSTCMPLPGNAAKQYFLPLYMNLRLSLTSWAGDTLCLLKKLPSGVFQISAIPSLQLRGSEFSLACRL